MRCWRTHSTWRSPVDASNKPVRPFVGDDMCRYCQNSSLDLDCAVATVAAAVTVASADVVTMANIACYSRQSSPNRYSTTNAVADVDGATDNDDDDDDDSMPNWYNIHCLHTMSTMIACCWCFRFLLLDKRNGTPDSCKYFLME